METDPTLDARERLKELLGARPRLYVVKVFQRIDGLGRVNRSLLCLVVVDKDVGIIDVSGMVCRAIDLKFDEVHGGVKTVGDTGGEMVCYLSRELYDGDSRKIDLTTL